MTEFSAQIIGINRVVSQDRGDRTSRTLKQCKARVFQPIRTKQLLASTYYFFSITGDAGFTILYM